MASLSPEDTALAELLGKLDSSFWPRRGAFEQARAQVRHCLRRDWRTKGLPSRSRGVGSTERKREEETWRQLESDGLVRVHASAGRRTHVRLTFPGEQRARALCATGDVITYWRHFEALVKLFDASGRNQLSEAFTADCTPWSGTHAQLEALTEQMFLLLPFLCAGWVSTWPDSECRQWLSLTDEGRAAHAAGCPDDPCPDVRLDERASTVYERAFRDYTTELEGMTPPVGAPVIVRAAVGIGWGMAVEV